MYKKKTNKLFDFMHTTKPDNPFTLQMQYTELPWGAPYRINRDDRTTHNKTGEDRIAYDRMVWTIPGRS